MSRRVDFGYTLSDERLRAYARVPLIERLRWLDELCRFTLMWREAPLRPAEVNTDRADESPRKEA